MENRLRIIFPKGHVLNIAPVRQPMAGPLPSALAMSDRHGGLNSAAGVLTWLPHHHRGCMSCCFHWRWSKEQEQDEFCLLAITWFQEQKAITINICRC